jgi:hypothetical protein
MRGAEPSSPLLPPVQNGPYRIEIGTAGDPAASQSEPRDLQRCVVLDCNSGSSPEDRLPAVVGASPGGRRGAVPKLSISVWPGFARGAIGPTDEPKTQTQWKTI